MTFNRQNIDGKIILTPEGMIDTANAPAFNEEVIKATDETKDLELDFSKIEYISSSGLRVLLKAEKKMQAEGGVMVITNTNDSVKEVFNLTGFSSILTIR